MIIDCQLDFTPGRDTIQAKLKLSVGGVAVFEEYEQRLTPGQREVTSAILAAHAKAMALAGERLAR